MTVAPGLPRSGRAGCRAGRSRRGQARAAGALRGLTPLLDTLFLLLFALLASSESRRHDVMELLRIRLPEVEAAASAAAPAQRIQLQIDERSQIRLLGSGRRYVDLRELDGALDEAQQGAVPEDVAVEILGDRAARHGVVVGLLQHLRLRGFVTIDLVAVGEEHAGRGSATEIEHQAEGPR